MKRFGVVAMMVVAVAALGMAAGCKKKEGEDSLAKKAGSKMGETLTDFGKGVGQGVDTQMQVKVELSDGLTQKGMSQTVAKVAVGKGGITVYLIAKEPLKGKLLAKALNKDGQEIGRSAVEVEFAADDAKYVTFEFPKEMDSQMVGKYVIDVSG